MPSSRRIALNIRRRRRATFSLSIQVSRPLAACRPSTGCGGSPARGTRRRSIVSGSCPSPTSPSWNKAIGRRSSTWSRPPRSSDPNHRCRVRSSCPHRYSRPLPSACDPICLSMASSSIRPASTTRRLERDRPAVPVRAIRLGCDRRDELPAKRLPIAVEARLDDRCAEAEHPRLPRRLEDEFTVPSRRSGGTVDVEQLGVHSRATPIIESRVTSAASSSSDRPSVPAGLSGTTR